MKVEVNIQKKYFFILLGAILIIGAGIFAYAFNSGTNYANPSSTSDVGYKNAAQATSFGHTADETNVKINGQVITLQDAINLGLLGNASGGSLFKSGSYIGNSGTQTIDVGFRPDTVIVYSGLTTDYFFIRGKNEPSGGAYITSLTANGFSVGGGNYVNQGGTTFYYAAWGESSGGAARDSNEVTAKIVFTIPNSMGPVSASLAPHVWIVPPGVTSAKVTVVGAGGGGSGGLSQSIITTIPGQIYNINVGKGGGTKGYFNSAFPGGNSYFSGNGIDIIAMGGLGGHGGDNRFGPGAPCLGGSGAPTGTGQITSEGLPGFGNCNGGGWGAPSLIGFEGGSASADYTGPPAGNGAGGGAGANGQIIIEYALA